MFHVFQSCVTRCGGFPGGSGESTCSAETGVRFPGWRRKWQPTPVHREIPGTEDPGGLQFMGLQKSQTRLSVKQTNKENANI